MSEGRVVTESHEGVAIVTLNRPPANALTAEFLSEIARRMGELEVDSAVKAVVLTGQAGVLSAGLDLKVVPNLDRAGRRATVDAINQGLGALYGFEKPLVTAANGHAIAGGLFLLLAADYRIGAEGDAQFGLTEVRVGVPFPLAVLEIARAELPAHAARRVVLGGRTVGVAQAARWGILDEVVSDDALLPRALRVAREHAASPPEAYGRIKRQLRAGALEVIRRTNEEESDPVREDWFSPASVRAAASAALSRAR